MNTGLPAWIYVVTFAKNANGTNGTNLFAGYQGGVIRSTDNGNSWFGASAGLPRDVHALLSYPSTAGASYLFAGTDSGVYVSTINGAGWSAASNGLTRRWINTLFACPNGAGGMDLFAGTSDFRGDGVFLSNDNGSTWTSVSNGLLNPMIRAICAVDSMLLAGSDGSGIFRSTNKGENWTPASVGMENAKVRSLVLNPASPGTVFAATASCGVFLTTNSGVDRVAASVGFTDREFRALAVNSNGSGGYNLFAAGSVVYISTNNGAVWNPANNGLPEYEYVATVAVRDGDAIFAGTPGGVFRSTDDGVSWTAANSGLTNLDIRALATSPSEVTPKFILAGTFGGGVFRSTDDGTNWLSANIGLTSQQVFSLSINPVGTEGVTYFAGTNIGVFRSTDNGASWIYPSEWAYITSFAKSGCDFFVGAQGAVYRQTSNRWWTGINLGLPARPTNFNALMANVTHLLAGTDDGVWKRPLYQITDVAIPPNVLPTEFALEQNYPNPFNPSTTISYQLPAQSHVTLKVFDVLGREVGTLVNEDLKGGSHETTFDATGLAGGVYLYRLQAGEFSQTRRLLLLR